MAYYLSDLCGGPDKRRINSPPFGAAICAYNGPRSMTENKITVTVDCGGNFNEGVDFFVDVELGRFLSGNYTLEVDLNQQPPLSLFTIEFTVTQAHAGVYFPVVDYTDHWWNAQEARWGVLIACMSFARPL